MQQKLVQIPAVVQGLNRKVDRSWTIKFETPELSGAQVKVLSEQFEGEGWLVFKTNDDIKVEEVPDSDATEGKTPSKRLRNTLYILWQQSGEPLDDFNKWYGQQMQRFIDTVKSKLED